MQPWRVWWFDVDLWNLCILAEPVKQPQSVVVKDTALTLHDLDNHTGILHVWFLMLEGLSGAISACPKSYQPQTMEMLFELLRSASQVPGMFLKISSQDSHRGEDDIFDCHPIVNFTITCSIYVLTVNFCFPPFFLGVLWVVLSQASYTDWSRLLLSA